MSVVLYTRADCRLCDRAKEAIDQVAAKQKLSIAMTLVDIDSDPAAHAQYQHDIPVIFVEGKEAFRHRVIRDDFVRIVREEAAKKEREQPSE